MLYTCIMSTPQPLYITTTSTAFYTKLKHSCFSSYVFSNYSTWYWNWGPVQIVETFSPKMKPTNSKRVRYRTPKSYLRNLKTLLFYQLQQLVAVNPKFKSYIHVCRQTSAANISGRHFVYSSACWASWPLSHDAYIQLWLVILFGREMNKQGPGFLYVVVICALNFSNLKICFEPGLNVAVLPNSSTFVTAEIQYLKWAAADLNKGKKHARKSAKEEATTEQNDISFLLNRKNNIFHMVS